MRSSRQNVEIDPRSARLFSARRDCTSYASAWLCTLLGRPRINSSGFGCGRGCTSCGAHASYVRSYERSHWPLKPQPGELVFSTAGGQALDAANVRRSFRAVCTAAGIGPGWTLRELRHTFVSLMSDSDVAVEEIARLVGHASSKVTESVYRHQLRPVLTTGAEKMDALLSGI